jgi:S1-C subfamily serine protease
MVRPSISTAALVGLLACAGPARAQETPKADAIRESVVKVFNTMRPPDPLHPWQKGTPQDAIGTGVVIEGKRILTNAHVVNYASQVFVQAEGSGDKVAATVESISPEIDLAVLKIEDDSSFFNGRPPITRTEGLPVIKEAVLVYGYPTGGSGQSLTKGIVSRIDFVPYLHGTSALRIQVDAAINPGNSGGPALVGDKMIGLVNSRLGGGDNIGYIIPSEEIDLFLKDVADGKYDGKPAMTDDLQTFENEVLKGKLGVKRAVGMIVNRPGRETPDYPLKKWDVITKIGDKEVDSVGMVQVKGDLRLRFQYLVQRLAKGGKVALTIIRDGKEQVVQVPVDPKHDELISALMGKYPSYFIYGPIVFSTATSDLVNALERNSGYLTLLTYIASPLATRRSDKVKFPGEELVIVCSPMFPHRTAKGYSNPIMKVVKEVNGVPIKNLRHLVETLRDAKDKYIIIDFNDKASETIVFDRQEILKATEEILQDNSVRQQYSEDLAPAWAKKK